MPPILPDQLKGDDRLIRQLRYRMSTVQVKEWRWRFRDRFFARAGPESKHVAAPRSAAFAYRCAWLGELALMESVCR